MLTQAHHNVSSTGSLIDTLLLQADWVRRMARWPFKQIIPAHLAAPIPAGPTDLLQAFGFLDDPKRNLLPQGDMRPLNAISRLLSLTGLVPPRSFGEA